MTWLAFAMAGFGVVLIGLALALRWDKQLKEERQARLGDRRELREALSTWEPLVLSESKNVRELKLFANRARFICAGADAKDVAKLVGFCALVEVRIIMNNDTFATHIEFQEWKEKELVTQQESQFGVFIGEADLDDWNRFRCFATGVRFPCRSEA